MQREHEQERGVVYCSCAGFSAGEFQFFETARSYSVEMTFGIDMIRKRYKLDTESQLQSLEGGCALKGTKSTKSPAHPQPYT